MIGVPVIRPELSERKGVAAMGFFSSSVPHLDERFEEALSPFFGADVVGAREYKSGLRKLAGAQGAILTALETGEELNTIVPCFGSHSYQGFALLTSRRVIDFKGRVKRQISLRQVAKVEKKAHPGGFFLVNVISQKAMLYSTESTEYWLNVIQFEMSDPEVMGHFVAILDGLRK
jgi:hypothetical protein